MILFQTWSTASAVIKAMEAIVMLGQFFPQVLELFETTLKSSGATVSMGSAAQRWCMITQ